MSCEVVMMTRATRSPVPDRAGLIYHTYLASVCKFMGLRPTELRRQLARPGRINLDPAWRRAAYARQLAMYLTSTEANVTQAELARLTGLHRAGVHQALHDIEDLRDNPDYESLVQHVVLDVALNGGAS